MEKIVIVGGGLSGLATAFYLQEQAKLLQKPIELMILEKNSRIGGKIHSIQEAGYLCEYGPNGFLDNKPDTLDLCDKLGLTQLLLRSNDNARKRFVVENGKLYQLPHSPLDFLKSNLISWSGKLRMFGEIFIKPNLNRDESVANFAARRLGFEALDKLIAPMASGIYAGEPKSMSISACFPRIRQLEQDYGGLFKAMIALRKNKTKSSGSPAGPGGILTSFFDGITILTKALAEQIELKNIRLNIHIDEILYDTNHYQIYYTEGGIAKQIECDRLVLATPAYATAKLVQNISNNLSLYLNQIQYSPIVVVCLGYDLAKIKHNMNGFGYLFTQNNLNSKILGTLWDSSIFVNRAPDGKILFRSMLGGARTLNINDYSEQTLVNITKKSLKNVLNITEEAEYTKLFRHEKAIPQYNVGHLDLLNKINSEVAKYNNLYLVGNAYNGIGINDCIRNAKQTAIQIIANSLSIDPF